MESHGGGGAVGINETRPRSGEAMFCGGCGRAWGAGERFCGSCGASRPGPGHEAGSAAPVAPVPVLIPLEAAAATPAPAESPVVTATPVASLEEPAPEPRRRYGRIAVAGTLVVALGAALVVVLTGGGKASGIDAALSSADSSFGEVATAVAKADTLAEVREAGAAAGAAVDPLEDALAEMTGQGEAGAGNAAQAAVGGHRDLALAWSGLADLSEDSPDGWASVADAIDEATSDWRRDQNPRAAAGLEAFDSGLRRTVESASDGSRDWLEANAVKLAGWKAEVERVTAERGAALADLDGYLAVARPQLDRYAGLRKELSNFTAEVGDMTFSRAYSEISDALSARYDVREILGGATAPVALTGAHSELLAIIDTAIDALASAYSGLSDYEYYRYYYDSFEDTPGWESFQEQSTGISAAWTKALAAWEQQVDDERARAEGMTPPAKPSI